MRRLSQHLAVREAAYTIFDEYSLSPIYFRILNYWQGLKYIHGALLSNEYGHDGQAVVLINWFIILKAEAVTNNCVIK